MARETIPDGERFALVDAGANPPRNDIEELYAISALRNQWSDYNTDGLEDPDEISRLDTGWEDLLNRTLILAQCDIHQDLKSSWWDKEASDFYSSRNYRRGYGLEYVGYTFEPSRLDPEQWTKCCVYRALSTYLFPQMITFNNQESDSFAELAKYFGALYEQEWSRQRSFGIGYDLDNDGTIEDEIEEYEVRDDQIVN